MLSPTESFNFPKVLQWVIRTTEGIDLASGQSNRSLHVAIELIREVTAQDDHILLVSFGSFG